MHHLPWSPHKLSQANRESNWHPPYPTQTAPSKGRNQVGAPFFFSPYFHVYPAKMEILWHPPSSFLFIPCIQSNFERESKKIG